jgi:CRP/FNR family cyclic AMP-dependent transcriptional regulator
VNVERALAEVPLFAGVEAPVLSAMARHARVLERKKRQAVIRQGAPADAVYGVVRGYLKIALENADGSSASLSVLGPGDIFGEIGVLGGVARSAALVALEDAVLLSIPGAVFLEALGRSAALGLALSRLLAERLRITGEHFSHVTMLPAPARFAQRLLLLIERFGRAAAAGTVLDVPLTQLDLAELAQLSRQRTNQLLQELKRREVLAWEGRRLVVLDVERLRGVAAGA